MRIRPRLNGTPANFYIVKNDKVQAHYKPSLT